MKKIAAFLILALFMLCQPLYTASAEHFNRVEHYCLELIPASDYSSFDDAHFAEQATNYRVGWENRLGNQSFFSAFTLEEDGLLQMNFSSPRNAHSLNEKMDLAIYRADGEKIWASDTEDEISSSYFYVGLESGSYMLSMEVNFASARTDGLESGFWLCLLPSEKCETEPNNNSASADKLHQSGSLRGWIDNPYWETDYFAIEVEEKTTGYITVWSEDVPEDASCIDSLSATPREGSFGSAIRGGIGYGPFPDSTRLYSRLSVYFVDSSGKTTELPRREDLMETKGELNLVDFTEGTNYIVVCGFEPHFAEQMGYCIQWDVKDTHIHNYMSSYVNNCTGESYRSDVCTVCGDELRFPEESHHVIEYENVYPTCTEPGYKSAVCSLCGYQEYYEVLPPNHNMAIVEIYTQATCAQEGFAKKQCVLCGYTEDMVVPMNEHRKGIVDHKMPTCQEAGYGIYDCYTCDQSFEEIYPVTDHEFELLTTVLAAGCETEGLQKGVCHYCGEEFEFVIPAKGHDYYPVVLDEGSCTSRACVRMDCRGCDSSYMSEGNFGEHKWNGGTIHSGSIVSNCTLCGETKTIARYFDDVKPSWYAESVTWAVDNGISTGVSTTAFAPDALCTRAQVVTFLWRAAGEPGTNYTENPFADVSSEAYYYDAVLWAVANGITTGVDASHFAPNNSCTRAQVLAFLFRAEGTPPAAGESRFADIREGLWCHDAVLWAVNNGITNGLSADKFGPNEVCTRAQVLTFLWRDLA